MIVASATPPTPEEFNALRTACGWAAFTADRAARALGASIAHATLRDDGRLIAMGASSATGCSTSTSRTSSSRRTTAAGDTGA